MPARPRLARRRPERTVRGPPARVLIARAFVRGRLQPVEIAVNDEGRIDRIARDIPGGERMDLGERILLPAATDLHVHFREPAEPGGVEDFRSGTEGALLGGVTTVGEMPNGPVPTDSVARIRAKADRAERRLACDAVLYAGVHAGVDVARLGAVAGAFKLYLSPTPGIDDVPDDALLARALGEVAATGLGLTVHAEDPRRFRPPVPPASLRRWADERPPAAEAAAVDRILAAAPPALRLHVAHVSTAATAARLAAAGHSFEVAPHHVLLSADDAADTRRKVNPPLRPEAERAALWAALADGHVPIVASDHAPHPTTAKERPFPDAPSGMPGVETMLPLLLEQVRGGKLRFDRLLAMACDRPARWFGLPHGRLVVGEEAHLIAVDFRRRTRIEAARLRSPSGWSAFEGWPAIVPTHHFRFGAPVVTDGEFSGSLTGRIVRPDYAPRAGS